MRDDGPEGTRQRAPAAGPDPERAGRARSGATFTRRRAGAFRGSTPLSGKSCMQAVHAAIKRGLLRSCHDLSEGGLAVALAEMAFAGGLGAQVSLAEVPRDADASSDLVLLFSESPTRFVVEVRPECLGELADLWKGLPFCRLGRSDRADSSSTAMPRRV